MEDQILSATAQATAAERQWVVVVLETDVRWWEKSCRLLGQAGADEEKAWGCRGSQGKTGQRQDFTLGTLSRLLQVSDWKDEQQSLSEWEKEQAGSRRQRSLVDKCSGPSAESIVFGRCQPPPQCRSRVGLADHKTTLPTPRSDSSCDTYQIPVFMHFESPILS